MCFVSPSQLSTCFQVLFVVNFFFFPFACEYVVTLPLFTSSKDVPHKFSSIFGVCMEVADLEVRDIPEVGAPSLSLLSTDPSSVLGGPSLSPRSLGGTPSPVTNANI